jgi:two-component system chemotaxis response regulator CheY
MEVIESLRTEPPKLRARKKIEGFALKRAILVVDDDVTMRALVSFVLRDAGYSVVEAADGMDAIERIADMRERRSAPFCAIVSDVCMPGLSGLDMLTVLRCASMSIPVILMTAFANDRLREEAQGLGAAEILAKPLEMETLTASVARTVRRSWPSSRA